MRTFTERRARITVTVSRVNAMGTMQPYAYVFEKHRMRIQVRQGGKQFNNAHIEIFGVAPAAMNQIARLQYEPMTPENRDAVAVDVWDGTQFIPFFSGNIIWSAVDASAMPQVKLVIDSSASGVLANTPVAPYANAGPVTLQDALADIVGETGFGIVYSGSAPTYMLTDVRVSGAPLQQVSTLLQHFPELTWFVNLRQIVVRMSGSSISDDALRVSVDTGMQYAPVYSTSGLNVTTIFNPLIRPGIGLTVETTFDFVNRTRWVAAVLSHQLDVNVPGGQWITAIAANRFGVRNDGN